MVFFKDKQDVRRRFGDIVPPIKQTLDRVKDSSDEFFKKFLSFD